MAQQNINIGSSASDGTGDELRVAFDKVNDNFTELYATAEYSGLTYSNVSSVTSGSGTNARFTVNRFANTYTVDIINNAGTSYAVSDTLTIFGNALGGTSGVNDVTLTVLTLANATVGNIATISNVGVPANPVLSVNGQTGDVTLDVNDIANAASKGYVTNAINGNVATLNSSFTSVNANVTAANAVISTHTSQIQTLDANVGTLWGNVGGLAATRATISYVDTSIDNALSANAVLANVTSINANVTAANVNIENNTANLVIFRANLGAQDLLLDALDANVGTIVGNSSTTFYTLVSNAATQSIAITNNTNSINNLFSNAGTQADSINNLTANAATQGAKIDSIDANLGVATTNISALQSNTGVTTNEVNLLRANITAANATIASNDVDIQAIDANLGLKSTKINSIDANLGTATTNITNLTSNAATQATSINTLTANAATQATSIDTLTANAGTQATSIDTLTANAAAQSVSLVDLQNNAGAQSASITTLDANLGTATTNITTLTANAGTQATSINTLDANLGLVSTGITSRDANIGYIRSNYANTATSATFVGNVSAAYLLATSNVKVTGSLEVGQAPSLSLPNDAAVFTGNINGDYQVAVQNKSTGTNARSELQLYANDATLTNKYLEVAINNSATTGNFTVPAGDTGVAGYAHDSTITAIGGNIGVRTDNNLTLVANTAVVSLEKDGNLALLGNTGITFSGRSGFQNLPYTLDVEANIGVLAVASQIGIDDKFAIQANVGSFQTYANLNIDQINANMTAANAVIATIDTAAVAAINANIAAANVNIATLDANVGTIVGTTIPGINANLGTVVGTTIPGINANIGTTVGTTIPAIDANLGTATTNITTINANVSAANAVISTATTNISTLDANVGTIVGTTIPGINANIGTTVGTTIPALDANVGTIVGTTIPAIDANIGTTVGTTIPTINANIGAYQAYANLTFGGGTYNDANVAAYTGNMNNMNTLTAVTVNATNGNITTLSGTHTGVFAGTTATAAILNATAGNITQLTAGDLLTGNQGDVRFNDADGSNFVALQAPATIASNVTLTLPASDAAVSGYALVSDAGGTLSWSQAGATVTNDTSTNTNFNVYFAATTSGALNAVKYDTDVSYNPSTATLSSTNFAGTLATAAQPNITSVGQLTGLNVSGNAIVNGNLTVANLNSIASHTLNVQDPLLELTANTTVPYNYDIGFFSEFTGGSANVFQHTGVVRDYTDSTWKIFSNVDTAPGATINWADTDIIYEKLRVGNLTIANATASTNSTTGALILAGGAGVAGAINSAGNVGAPHVNATTSIQAPTINAATALTAVAATISANAAVNHLNATTSIQAPTINAATALTAVAGTFSANVGASHVNVTNSVQAVDVNATGTLDTNQLKVGGTNVTSNAGELNLVDGAIADTVVNSKAVIYSAAGNVRATALNVTNSVQAATVNATTAITTVANASVNHLNATTSIQAPTINAATSLTAVAATISANAAVNHLNATTSVQAPTINAATALTAVAATISANAAVNHLNATTSVQAPTINAATSLTAVAATISANVGASHVNVTNSVQAATINATTVSGGTGSFSGNVTASYLIGTATSALYADLAENYQGDEVYNPGTVLVFGGEQEVTVTSISHDERVAGIVSTNPAYLMNSNSGNNSLGLTGRLPCMVRGPVNKGTLLVTSETPGVAQALDKEQYQPGCVIGKSLEVIEGDYVALIEVAVGRY